jgi:hypothetical protein
MWREPGSIGALQTTISELLREMHWPVRIEFGCDQPPDRRVVVYIAFRYT